MSTHAYPIRAVWDIPAEVKARDRGMRLAASAHNRDLELAREIARELGADGSHVWADRVRVVLAERHPDITPGNWLGSLFRGKEWEPKGFVYSRTPGSHSNRLVRWALRKAEV
jgi:hypothetical protein